MSPARFEPAIPASDGPRPRDLWDRLCIFIVTAGSYSVQLLSRRGSSSIELAKLFSEEDS